MSKNETHHDKDHKDYVNVFSKGFTGGPHNLGDPNDKSLRHVEEYIFINNMIRDRAHHEKCKDFVKSLIDLVLSI